MQGLISFIFVAAKMAIARSQKSAVIPIDLIWYQLPWIMVNEQLSVIPGSLGLNSGLGWRSWQILPSLLSRSFLSTPLFFLLIDWDVNSYFFVLQSHYFQLEVRSHVLCLCTRLWSVYLANRIDVSC